MKIEKILVHLEKPELPPSLVEKLQRLASQRTLVIELFFCCYNAAVASRYEAGSEAEKHAVSGYLKEQEGLLIPLAEALERQGLTVGYDVMWHRDSSTALIKKALRFQADLLMAPMHKHHLGHYLMRYGDWQLISDCPVPLMLYRQHTWGEHPRIAAAIDPFHSCEDPASLDQQIIDITKYCAQQTQAEIHLIHSYNVVPQSAIFDEHLTVDFEAFQQQAKEQHTDSLHQLLKELHLSDAVLHLEAGEVHKVLPEIAKRERIDVVVMGTLARGVLDRFLLGSSVERVLDTLTCDVLLVKAPGFVSPVSE